VSDWEDPSFRIRSVKGPPLYDPVVVFEHVHGSPPRVGIWITIHPNTLRHPNLVTAKEWRIERLTPTDEHRVYEALLRPIHYEELGIVGQCDEDVFRDLKQIMLQDLPIRPQG